MERIDQTIFGSAMAPLAERGNCLQACVAMLTGRRLDQVPHFNALHDDNLACSAALQDWLRSIGMRSQAVQFGEFTPWYLDGVPAILSGPSSRYTDGTHHAVVGWVQKDGTWIVWHDPHPSREGLAQVTCVEFLFRPLHTPYMGWRPADLALWAGKL